jgi:hypothetical protein
MNNFSGETAWKTVAQDKGGQHRLVLGRQIMRADEGTVSGPCPVAVFDSNSVEFSGFATIEPNIRTMKLRG